MRIRGSIRKCRNPGKQCSKVGKFFFSFGKRVNIFFLIFLRLFLLLFSISPHSACKSSYSACNSPHWGCNTQYRGCNSPYRGCNSPHRGCNIPQCDCNSPHVACNISHRVCYIPHGDCNSPHGYRNSPYRGCNSPHRGWNIPHGSCNFPHRAFNSPHGVRNRPKDRKLNIEKLNQNRFWIYRTAHEKNDEAIIWNCRFGNRVKCVGSQVFCFTFSQKRKPSKLFFPFSPSLSFLILRYPF